MEDLPSGTLTKETTKSGATRSFVVSLLIFCVICLLVTMLPGNACAISGGGLPEQPPSEPIEGLWLIEGNGSIIKIGCAAGDVEPYRRLECYGYFVSLKKMNWRLPDQPLFRLETYHYPNPHDTTLKEYHGVEYSGIVKNQTVGNVSLRFSYFNQDKLFYHLQSVRGEQRVTLTRVKKP